MIPVSRPDTNAHARRYVLDCFRKNWFSQGEYNQYFESAFAERFKSRYASTCSNGSMALWLALKACGVGKDDEVIVPTFTFSATATSVIHAGGTPVFVDSEEQTLAMAPKEVERAITKKTKAIIVVHLYGLAADMNSIMRIARKHKLYVIEDAAEAIGGTYKGKPLGSIGDIGCFSFFGNKILSTGEGGMCLTRSKAMYNRINAYKNHGGRKAHTYWCSVLGFNARMTNMQAALGLSQLENLEKNLRTRYRIFERYARAYADMPGVVLLPYVERMYAPWLYTLRVVGVSKEKVVAGLARKGVDSRPGFYPCHTMPVFKPYVKKGQRFPVAERLSKEIINIPTYVDLTAAASARVISALRNVLASGAPRRARPKRGVARNLLRVGTETAE